MTRALDDIALTEGGNMNDDRPLIAALVYAALWIVLSVLIVAVIAANE